MMTQEWSTDWVHLDDSDRQKFLSRRRLFKIIGASSVVAVPLVFFGGRRLIDQVNSAIDIHPEPAREEYIVVESEFPRWRENKMKVKSDVKEHLPGLRQLIRPLPEKLKVECQDILERMMIFNSWSPPNCPDSNFWNELESLIEEKDSSIYSKGMNISRLEKDRIIFEFIFVIDKVYDFEQDKSIRSFFEAWLKAEAQRLSEEKQRRKSRKDGPVLMC